MLIRIYFRCKPIYKSVTQKKLPSYKSKVYVRDNFFGAITYNKKSTKDLEQNKKNGQNLNYHYIWAHGKKRYITFSEIRYLILKLKIVKKQHSNFSKNRCYISKLKMVKKPNSIFSKHRCYI